MLVAYYSQQARIASGMTSLNGKAHRIALDGEYDLSRKAEVADLFKTLDGDGALVIDLTKVDLHRLDRAAELAALRLRYADRCITLEGVNRHIHRVFAVVNFDRIFEIVD